MNINYTQFTIDFYDQVIDLWKKCEGIGLSGADSREDIQKYLQRNPGMSHIARDLNTVVGSILCGHDGRRGYIHHLAVNSEFQCQGIGRKLVEKSIAVLQDFDLDRKYDAILCLFSSIGYAKTIANVQKVLICFKKHLNPGGIILVEPWFDFKSWKPESGSRGIFKGIGVNPKGANHDYC